MMEKELRDKVTEQVKALIAAPSVYAGLKEVAQAWLAAAGTAQEDAATQKLVAELKEDVQTIDQVLPFFESADAAKLFGADQAAAMADQARKVKAGGGKYCFCPACTAGAALLQLLA